MILHEFHHRLRLHLCGYSGSEFCARLTAMSSRKDGCNLLFTLQGVCFACGARKLAADDLSLEHEALLR